jgi:hypothetical protein
MPNKARIKVARALMYRKQGGHCHYCNILCILPECVPHPINFKLTPQIATLDHIYDRFHPLRMRGKEGEKRYVMACWKCNTELGRQRCRENLEEHKRRSLFGQLLSQKIRDLPDPLATNAPTTDNPQPSAI